MTSVSVLLFVLASCGKYKEDKWYQLASEVSCETAKRCDTVNFWFNYDSIDACVDDTLASTEPPGDGCVYDKKAARKCVDSMKWSCKKIGERYEELQAQCQAVWDCPEEPEDTSNPLQPF